MHRPILALLLGVPVFMAFVSAFAQEGTPDQKQQAQPLKPTPFHGMEELASRRGWIHEPYFRVDTGTELEADRPWVEDFQDAQAWFANNPRTPPSFVAEGGILTLKDPPGGEVTWGTSIYTNLPSVNLDENPFLAVKVADLSSSFAVVLVNRVTHQKIGDFCRADKPGVFVVNIPEYLGWRGVMPLDVGVYTHGTESWVKLDYIKITGKLTPEEQAAYEKQRETQAKRTADREFSLPDARPHFNPYFRQGAHYLSERLIYRDSVTGNPVWRMTNHPDVDSVIYYDISHWNADGTLLRWNSSRGGSRQWLMNADGADLRAFELPSRAAGYDSHWSIHDPNVFYYSADDGQRSVVYRFNIRTGEETEVASLDEPGFSMAPPHPDEKHFLLSKRSKNKNTTIIYLLAPDGLKRKFDFGRFVHRLRFTKSPGHDIFYNFDDPRTQWAIAPDGSNNVHLTDTAGHPDWTWDGQWFTTYQGGNIEVIRRDGKEPYTLVNLQAGGHGGPALDGRSFISDVSRGGPYADSILYIDMPSRVTHKVCMAYSSYYGHNNSFWHPDHHSTHPHPSSSPDATKTIFSSDFMSKYVNIYVCINRLPDAPRNLTVKDADGKTILTWEPGERHRETAGYYVYRAEESGGPYRQANPELVKGTSLPIDEPKGFFVVTAAEPSGLESLPSEEVCAAPVWQGRVRRVVEAESCALKGALRPCLEAATAVGMYYVGCQPDKQEGAIMLKANLPKEGAYTLFARMRGEGKFRVADDGNLAASGSEWTWAKMDKPLRLGAGEQQIALTMTEGKPEVDQFIITDEAGFVPKGPAVLDNQPPDPPRELAANVLDPFAIRLSWKRPDAMDLSHYNVYCGRTADYEPCQARLIGSPSDTQFVDWGLAPSSEYHYKVAAVDRAGNESTPVPVNAATLEAKSATVTVEAETGKLADPAKVVDDKNAEGGKAVEFPRGKEKGRLQISFDLPFDERYAIWAHASQLEGDPTPVTMSLDEKGKQAWRVAVPMKKWGWDSLGAKRSGDPQLFALSKGKHVLTLSAGEGQRIDKIVVSNDPTWPHNGFETLRRKW